MNATQARKMRASPWFSQKFFILLLNRGIRS